MMKSSKFLKPHKCSENHTITLVKIWYVWLNAILNGSNDTSKKLDFNYEYVGSFIWKMTSIKNFSSKLVFKSDIYREIS